MLRISYSSRFKKDFKTVKKCGYDISLLNEVLELLCAEQPLPQKYHHHARSGGFDGRRECHITPDWLLIYKVERDELMLALTRTESHSDLF